MACADAGVTDIEKIFLQKLKIGYLRRMPPNAKIPDIKISARLMTK